MQGGICRVDQGIYVHVCVCVRVSTRGDDTGDRKLIKGGCRHPEDC